MLIPFLGPTYNGRSSSIDASRCVNLYPELTGTQDNKTQLALVNTPGLLAFSVSMGTNPIRGLHVFNGRMFAIIDSNICEINTNGSVSILGTINTSTGRVQMLDNGVSNTGVGGNQLLIIDGTDGYILDITTDTKTTIPTNAGGGWQDLTTGSYGPVQAAFIDGYFVVTNGTMKYWVSDLYDGLTWNALAFSPVAGTSDSIVAVVAHRQQLYFLKQNSTEVWYDSGTSTSFGSPFARVSGAVLNYGCAAPWSVAKAGDSFFFLGTSRMGSQGEVVGVYEVTEYGAVPVSTPAIAYRITTSSNNTNCFAYSYTESGHVFYVLTNPDNDWTLVYDITTKMWHERSSFGINFSTAKRHVSNCYVYFNKKHYVGSYIAPTIYEMSENYYTDGGNVIRRWRTAQTLQDKDLLDNVFVYSLQFDMETGVGSDSTQVISSMFPAGRSGTANVLLLADGTTPAGAVLMSLSTPTIGLSWSKDEGDTWSTPIEKNLGTPTNKTQRAIFRRLGAARNRIFKFSTSDPMRVRIANVYIEAGK